MSAAGPSREGARPLLEEGVVCDVRAAASVGEVIQ